MFSEQLHYTEIRDIPQPLDMGEGDIMYSKYEKLRNKKGVTNGRVARDTDIPPSCFYDWKAGRYKPKVDKLIKLAAYFGVELEELL